jgi:aryl-alcohol dehydrogenase-like predicted oxidoreductase
MLYIPRWRIVMQMRKLGNTGLEMAPLVFGGNVFGWTIDAAASFRMLDAFVDAGLNAIDTSDVYSFWVPGNQGGESETIIGQWAKRSGKRGRVLIFTKVGIEYAPGKKGLKKDYILRAAEDSLRRLQTDYIDVYFSHMDDPETPPQETLEAYAKLIEQGKVRAIGASNFGRARLAESLAIAENKKLPRYEVLEPHYNLVARVEYERELEPLALEKKLGVITYFSLASGFLTGKYRTASDFADGQRAKRAQWYLNEHGLKVLGALDEVAKQTNSNPARVALAWLMARPSVTAPIASATKLEQLTDLVEATRLSLSPAAIEKLNRASEGEPPIQPPPV